MCHTSGECSLCYGRKTKNENKPHTKVYNHRNRARKNGAYLHLFKIVEKPTCPCGKEDQTTDHLIFECELLTKERDRLKSTVIQTNKWPTNKKNLIKRHYKDYTKFVNEIAFDELNEE
jgi:hypothetical protein